MIKRTAILPPAPRGRLTTGWKVTGTVFFRLASAALLGIYGGNAQNPSEAMMRSVVPDEGKIFVSADQAGAEAVIVAYEAPPGKFLKLIQSGVKPHEYMAVVIFNDEFHREFFAAHSKDYFSRVPVDEIKKLPEWPAIKKSLKGKYSTRYFLGKKSIHSGNYDVGPNTFLTSVIEETAGQLVLTLDQVKKIQGAYSSTFPEILEWQNELQAKMLARTPVRNLFGHPIYITERYRHDTKRKFYAAVPQSTVGTITNVAFSELQRKIERERLPWDLLNNKHDSILLQCPDTREHIEMAADALRSHIGRDLVSSRGVQYRMGTEVSVGRNWGKWHEEHNPLGMKEI